MSEWKKYKLGEICELHYGKSLTAEKRIAGDIPVYSSAGITGWHNDALVNSRGVIVGRKGTVGTVYYSPMPFFCIDTAYYILPNDEVYDLKYLYYRLKALHLDKLNEDSAVPGLNRDTAYAQEFMLPPMEEQKRIAGILSALDDKIELNRRINANLELQAQTLFNYWFAGNQNERNSIVLGDIIDIVSGKSPKPNNKTGLYPILGANGEIGRADDYLFDDRIIFTGRVGTLGQIYRVENKKVWLSDNTLVIRPRKGYNFVYFYLKSARLQEYNVGSTQPLIRQSDIKAIKLTIPEDAKLMRFENICDKLFSQIYRNNDENKRLADLRDTLLPKLISNQLK